VLAVLHLERQSVPLGLIWGLAVLFRLTLLFSPPSLSDDIYRYLWDGHLLNLGVNPYAFPVNSTALEPFNTSLRLLVNHNWMASPYLPAAAFRTAQPHRPAEHTHSDNGSRVGSGNRLAGDGHSWRAWLARQRVLIYLWDPLVVVEFAHETH
jgi:hypothetical protein